MEQQELRLIVNDKERFPIADLIIHDPIEDHGLKCRPITITITMTHVIN